MMVATRSKDGIVTLAILAGVAALAVTVKTYGKTLFDAIFDREAQAGSLDADLLRAISRVESSMNPAAVSKPNRDGTRDYGLMQINERTAAHYGVQLASLLDPETSVMIARRLLVDVRDELQRAGKLNPYTLVSAYNAGSPAVIRNGIQNSEYVARVFYQWMLFSAGRVVA